MRNISPLQVTGKHSAQFNMRDVLHIEVFSIIDFGMVFEMKVIYMKMVVISAK